jgi:hypothetical protein
MRRCWKDRLSLKIKRTQAVLTQVRRVIPKPDKRKITKNKHQIANKFQITISKSQRKSKADGLMVSQKVPFSSRRSRIKSGMTDPAFSIS